MLKDRCISVTDLRTKTKQCLSCIKGKAKYIFSNNRPLAVLMDITEYEEHFLKPELQELTKDEVNAGLQRAAQKARKLKKSSLLNI